MDSTCEVRQFVLDQAPNPMAVDRLKYPGNLWSCGVESGPFRNEMAFCTFIKAVASHNMEAISGDDDVGGEDGQISGIHYFGGDVYPYGHVLCLVTT